MQYDFSDKNHFMYNHSEIIDFPFDTDRYQNFKNIQFLEYNLNKGDYLLMPPNWTHWVFTDPNTVALSFDIKNGKVKGRKKEDILMDFIIKKEPYQGKGKELDFDYKEVLQKLYSKRYHTIFSETTDTSPVYKNDSIKYFKFLNIPEIHDEINETNLYSYTGGTPVDEAVEFKDIRNFIDIGENVYLDYEPSIWISFDKKIQSGMHFDSSIKLLYVLDGRKKVLLLPPNLSDKLYFRQLKRVHTK